VRNLRAGGDARAAPHDGAGPDRRARLQARARTDQDGRVEDGARVQIGGNTTLKFLWADELEALYQMRLAEGALQDPLTGLYNRRYFFALAELEFKRAVQDRRPLSVILMDVDYFKQINDSYGHPTGDRVLEKLSLRARDALRKGDALARYGGEEFAVLLPETDLAAAVQVAERLRLSIAQIEDIPGAGQVEVTASLGVATLDATPGLDFDQLLDRADRALYTAKHSSRNRVCIWEEKNGA
jgi:diguanylate cyclase (GGDEF)-like protein